MDFFFDPPPNPPPQPYALPAGWSSKGVIPADVRGYLGDVTVISKAQVPAMIAYEAQDFGTDQYCEIEFGPTYVYNPAAFPICQACVRRHESDKARLAFSPAGLDPYSPDLLILKRDGISPGQTFASVTWPSGISLPTGGHVWRVETRNVGGFPNVKGFINSQLVIEGVDTGWSYARNGYPSATVLDAFIAAGNFPARALTRISCGAL